MKKLLALVLELVMTMGLATVGTSAAFADAADIDHTEAVEVMNALGIIGGKENNNFDPDGNVKRSEMAKMVTIALLGDVEVSAFTGTATDMTDIDGHWAEGYIKYCYSQGIIGGRGNGLFDPEANVTTAEASKMLLVALGYSSDVRGYTGEGWTINVARDAQQKGLYKSIENLASGKAMDRDDAAQLIYNTLTAVRVVGVQGYNSDGVLTTQYYDATASAAGVATGDEKLLGKTFDGISETAYLTSITYNPDNSKYTYTLSKGTADEYYGAVITSTDKWTDTTTKGSAGSDADGTLSSKTDYSEFFGQKVTVVYAVPATGSRSLLGIYGQGKVLAAGVVGQIKDVDTDSNTTITAGDDSVKIDETTVKLDKTAGTTYIVGFDAAPAATAQVDDNHTTGTGVNDRPFFIVKAVDNDNDDKADVFLTSPVIVAKVVYLGSSTATITTQGAGLTNATVTLTKDSDTGLWKVGSNLDTSATVIAQNQYIELPADVAKDDFIQIARGVTGAAHKATVIPTTTAKVTGTKTGKAQIDGETWINQAIANPVTLGSTYDFKVVNGFFFDADEVISATNDILLVEDVSSGLSGLQAKVLFSDGKEDIVTISKVGDNTNPTAGDVVKEKLYTYELSDGKYKIKAVGTSNLAGNETYYANTFGYVKSDSKTAAKVDASAGGAGSIYLTIADSAIVFLYDTSADTRYTVITGEALKKYDSLTFVDANGQALAKGTDAKVLYLRTSGAVSDTNIWAYVTEDGYSAQYTANGTTSNLFFTKVWTTDGAKNIYMDTQKNAGAIVELKLLSDGSYQNVARTVKGVAIKSYQNGNITAVYGPSGDMYIDGKKLASSTQVLYVNNKTNEGVTGGSILEALRASDNGYITNAYAYMTDADTIRVLVIDQANNWDDNNGTTGAIGQTSATYTLGDDVVASAYVLGVDITPNGAASKKVVAGDTITFKVTYKASGSNIAANSAYVYIYDNSEDVTLINSTLAALTPGSGTSGAVFELPATTTGDGEKSFTVTYRVNATSAGNGITFGTIATAGTNAG